jgi:hypothetical protein
MPKHERNCVMPDAFTFTIKRPLPIKIPGDYAEKLGVHFTTLSKINHGTRRLPLDKCCLLLSMAKDDERLEGLTIYHLIPELEMARRFLCPDESLPPKRKKKNKRKGNK